MEINQIGSLWFGCLIVPQNPSPESLSIPPPPPNIVEFPFNTSCACPYKNFTPTQTQTLLLWDVTPLLLWDFKMHIQGIRCK